MRLSHSGRTVLAIALAGAVTVPVAPAFAAAKQPAADLRADVNRDGTVDVRGGTDTAGEDSWTTGRGAVFLPNIDDDSRRCPTKGPGGKPLNDRQLAACNDAADTKVNGTADAADLARLRTVPVQGLASGGYGTATITGAGAKHARLFIHRVGNGGWQPVTAKTKLTAAELRTGVELGMEGTDVVRDSKVWDGRAVVKLTVHSGGKSASDDVTLKVAPLLTHHHLQNAQEVLVTKMDEGSEYGRQQSKFVKDLGTEVKRAGISKPLVTFTKYGDPWAQDFVEPGYVSMAGPGGRQHAMRVMLRSAQPDRESGRELFEKLRGPGTGVVQVTKVRDSEEHTLNSTGNLETIPPYAHDGRSYPAGRIIMGQRVDSNSKPAAAMRTLLTSQGMQDPLLLDTSWLHVGHVDEFVQFLPANTPRGWRIGIADPQGGLKLLRDAQQAGHGKTRVFSVPDAKETPAPKETIDQALASKELRADNELAARRIATNLETLKRATGVTDAEVIRVPALYTRGTDEGADGDRTPTLKRLGSSTVPDAVGKHGQLAGLPDAGTDGATKTAGPSAKATTMTSAYVPGAVNGVVLARDRYLAPKQWGPVIGGKDIFTTAVTTAYGRAGMKVAYIDDWYTYHLGMGEVHCGTNTLRDVSAPWWKGVGGPS